MKQAASQSLWIVGSSVRAAVQSAGQAGVPAVAVDLFSDRDTREAAATRQIRDYPWELRTLLREPPEGPWMYTGGLENYPELLAELATIRPLLGNAADVVRQVRNPWRVREVLTALGIACPRLRLADEPFDDPTVRWLRKPLRSAGGHGISFVQPGPASWVSDAHYIQEWIEGTACSLTYLGDGRNAELLLVCRQLIGADWAGAEGFMYCGSVGPLPIDATLRDEAQAIGQVLALEFALVGLFGVDAVLVADGSGRLRFFPVEVNPRFTASVEVWERLSGESAVARHVAATGGSIEIASPATERKNRRRVEATGKAIIYARRDLAINHDILAEMLARFGRGHEVRVADVPFLDPARTEDMALIPRGRPVVTLLTDGQDLRQVTSRLQRAAENLHALLEQ